MRRTVWAGIMLLAASTAAMAEAEMHRVPVHVGKNDPAVIGMALNNVSNITEYYEAHGDEVIVEFVTDGPGLETLKGSSPVADQIEVLPMELPELTFPARQNTLDSMAEQAGHEIALLADATLVRSGAVRLIELQEDACLRR